MQKQRRPKEIKVIGIVVLVFGIIKFLIGLGLVTSIVSPSDLGLDTTGIETKSIQMILLYVGMFDIGLGAYCFFTVLCALKRIRCSWTSIIILSMVIYGTGFLAFKSGEYIDGIIDVMLSTVIISLMHTESAKHYLRKLQ